MSRHVHAVAGRLSLRAPQRLSLEILDRITELVPPRKSTDVAAALAAVRREFPSVTEFERDFLSVCFALATGVGKTRLMGAFISYLTEPLVKTTNILRNPRPLAPQQLLYPCTGVVELADQPRGAAPHYLPGENPFLTEFGAEFKLPEAATRGGAATMYPEFQNGLRAR